MGDPKFLRRTYDAPKHPWEAARMDEERKLLQKYGLKNKRELWKAQAILRGFRRQARDLQARLTGRRGAGEARDRRPARPAHPTSASSRPAARRSTTCSRSSIEDVLSRRFEWIVVRKGPRRDPERRPAAHRARPPRRSAIAG